MSEDFTPAPAVPEPKVAPINNTPDPKPNPAETTLPTEKPEKKDLDTILKDSLKKSQEKTEGKEEVKKPEPKSDPKVEAKTEGKAKEASEGETAEQKAERLRAPDGKFAPREGAKEPASEQAADAERNGQDGEKSRPSEGRNIHEPPARFLPRAKEQWANVPDDVKGEVYRAFNSIDKGLEEYKESHELRKELKPFEEMARNAGIPLPQAVKNYVELDQLVTQNPVEGVARILSRQNIDIVQFAQHVLGQAQQAQQNPQGAQLAQYEQYIQQVEQERQQERQRIAELEREMMTNQVNQSIIAPFAQQHPRYYELQDDIAFFLNSDKVPSTLSVQERLAVAYDMAERINPAPSAQQNDEPITSAPATRPLNSAGQKSVTGSPSSTAVKSTKTKGDATDLDAVLRRALSKAS